MKNVLAVFVIVFASSTVGVKALHASCVRDQPGSTTFFVPELRANYCGVSAVTIIHQQAYQVIESNALAFEDGVAMSIGWCVRFGFCGVTIPDLMRGAFTFTPYGDVFSEWEYVNKYEAIKGIAWTWNRYYRPVVIAGNRPGGADGNHYYLLNGVMTSSSGSNCNAYSGYPTTRIQGIYILDPMWASPDYGTQPDALRPNTLFRQGATMTLDDFITDRWHMTGATNDKKYRSIEKGCYACWSQQGATYENNTIRSSY